MNRGQPLRIWVWTLLVIALAPVLFSIAVPAQSSVFPGASPIVDIEAPFNAFVRSMIDVVEPYTEVIGAVLDHLVEGIEDALVAVSFVRVSVFGISFFLPVLAIVGVLLGILIRDLESVLYVIAGLGFIYIIGLWPEAMRTFALVLLCSVIIIVLGIPAGIAVAKSDFLNTLTRPILDFMQTLSAFVYLIPAVMFFGLGVPAGAVSILIFATPPIIRLTNLGIRGVPPEMVEAGRSFGAHPVWLLMRVELPLAWPTIMLGVNQTIMFSLSMTVIAAMIGSGGLGIEIIRGVQRLNTARGVLGGVSVAALAMILDRLTCKIGLRRKD